MYSMKFDIALTSLFWGIIEGNPNPQSNHFAQQDFFKTACNNKEPCLRNVGAEPGEKSAGVRANQSWLPGPGSVHRGLRYQLNPGSTEASDKQRLLKEVFHKQILPAGPMLKRAFLSPSSGTQPIELQPSEACIEEGYGPALHPSGPGPPSYCLWTPVSTSPQRGNLITQPSYLQYSSLDPFVSSAGAYESTMAALSTPRLVPAQELLTKTPCGNEGCVRRRREGVWKREGGAFKDRWLGKFPNFCRLGLFHGDGSAGLGAVVCTKGRAADGMLSEMHRVTALTLSLMD
ncbi:hypothetical protein Baya_11183 [Bagarius yarrelli]|uniref:Uncharacterized protein n=1 Tax=Bagarius yarrelli TaxID=175774 RepID=A0A556V0R1_BAGYA|nr:hypothetical protein Baya_11183 [Bagarius yarrelli]